MGIPYVIVIGHKEENIWLENNEQGKQGPEMRIGGARIMCDILSQNLVA